MFEFPRCGHIDSTTVQDTEIRLNFCHNCSCTSRQDAMLCHPSKNSSDISSATATDCDEILTSCRNRIMQKKVRA